MSTHRRARPIAVLTLASLGAILFATALAPAQTTYTAAKRITQRGVGAVTIGATYSRLRRQGLVGALRKGCELGGPNTRSAPLRAPLKGSVDFTLTSPRKVVDISVNGGATARGVGIGARLGDIKAAFPRAQVDHSTERTFAITLVKIPAGAGGRLQFGIDTKTKKVTIVGIPFIAVCD